MLQYHFNWKTLSAAAGITWWNIYFGLYPKTMRMPEVVNFLGHCTASMIFAGVLPHCRGSCVFGFVTRSPLYARVARHRMRHHRTKDAA